MSRIWIQKNGFRKKIEKSSWDLLKDKNGWVKIEDSTVENVIVKQAPDSGEKKQVIVSSPEVADNSNVENTVEVTKKQDQNVVNEAENAKFIANPDFMDFVKDNLSKSNLKDYFDSPEGKTTYKNTMSLEALGVLAAEKFNNNIEDLKIAFKIVSSPEVADNSGSNTGGL